MSYDAELAFFTRLLQHFNLQALRFAVHESPEIDMGLRKMLGLQDPTVLVMEGAKPNTIYVVADAFDCWYNGMLLPDTSEVLIIGPYLKQEIKDTDIMAMLEKHQLSYTLFRPLKHYYSMLPLVTQDSLMLVGLNTLGESLWGSVDNFSMQYYESWEKPHLLPKEERVDHPEGEEINARLVEARYEGERNLMHAVTNGMHHQAQMIISQWRLDMLEERVKDPIRNMRNYAIVLNTLLRKAVEEGRVHPVHIDQLSATMAKKIEQFHTTAEGMELLKTMVHKYCLLVKNHSMKHYSKLVEQVILRIETDLSADLSLKAHAQHLNVNASYLSTLFKKETGTTLTEYANRARIDQAIFLLNTTDMQIQTIAQYCGIEDVNYFTKLFKRTIGKTPREYRMDTRRMVTDV